MEKTDERLIEFFEEMRGRTGEFRKKSYDSVFMESFEKYKDLAEEIGTAVLAAPEEERDSLVEHFANVIPDYASRKVEAEYQGKSRNARGRAAVDYNLSIVVYVVPILNYTKNEGCEAVAKRLVELWNEKKITDMQISHSDYESVSAGFKRKFCYITTAVCESKEKPDDCPELTLLRGYRDGYLSESEEGRALVEDYYDIAPAIVMCIDMQKNRREIYDKIYETYLLPCIDDIKQNRMEACRERYTDMVHELSRQYLS